MSISKCLICTDSTHTDLGLLETSFSNPQTCEYVFFILVTHDKETTNFSAITAINENQYASEHIGILEQYTVETSTWQVDTLYIGLHYCIIYRAARQPMPIPLGPDLVQLYLQHLGCTKPETFTVKPNTNVVVSRTHYRFVFKCICI